MSCQNGRSGDWLPTVLLEGVLLSGRSFQWSGELGGDSRIHEVSVTAQRSIPVGRGTP